MARGLDTQVEALKRGAIEIIPEDSLRKRLQRSIQRGTGLRIKAGFDPTAPDIHLGHTVLLEKLRQFQEFGHTVIFLIGDFTGMVGDPSGVKATRPILTKEEILRNSETYREQIFRILDREKTEVRFNSEWLKSLPPEEILRLCSLETVARMLERDDFSARFREEKPIRIHEFIYPLLQGYDSVVLKADVEVGGTDQKFNLLMGRAVQQAYGMEEPQVVITLPLLVGTDGVMKMSKSSGNYIGINEDPKDIFGKVMSISDELMWSWYELLSRRPHDEIKGLKAGVSRSEVNPKKVKEMLAYELVARFHGEKEADAAQEHFERVFSRKGLPEDMPVIEINAGDAQEDIVSVIMKAGLAKSRSEVRRLIKQGAVEVNGERIVSEPFRFEKSGEYSLRVGKRRFARVNVTGKD